MRSSTVARVVVAALAFGAVGVEAWRLARHEGKARRSAARLESVAAEARELLALRARAERVVPRRAPERDTIARVNAALAGAGVEGSRLKEVAQESSSASAGEKEQSVRISLDSLGIPEVAAFLSMWREDQPAWAVSRVELTHSGASDEAEGLYAARVTVTASYLEEGGVP